MPDRYGDPEPDATPDDIWAAERRATEARISAELTAQAIADCGLCNDDGYHGSVVCDHTDHRPAAERGMALVREALKAKGAHACHVEREAGQ